MRGVFLIILMLMLDGIYFVVGSYISAFGVLLFLLILWRTFSAGAKVAETRGGGCNYVWTLPSPPAFHSYDELPGSNRV